jgi:putative NADH-flavin reductase
VTFGYRYLVVGGAASIVVDDQSGGVRVRLEDRVKRRGDRGMPGFTVV